MSNEKEMMSEEEMLELDDSIENDKELREKIGDDVKDLDEIDDAQLED